MSPFPTSGLYHFRNRDFSPTLGRWLQVDPTDFLAGDPNLYRFVGNKPLTRLDPQGLEEEITSANLNWTHFQVVDKPQSDDGDQLAQIAYYFYDASTAQLQQKTRKACDLYVSSITGEFQANIKVRVDKKNTWVLKTSKDDATLEHERLHLRFAEYVAEKSKANIDLKIKVDVEASDKNQDTAKSKAKKAAEASVAKQREAIIKKVNDMDDKLQKEYDRRTRNGALVGTQKEWEKNWKAKADAILKENGWTK